MASRKTTIRAIVRDQLQDFHLRQKARDEKRKAANETQRAEVNKLKRRVRF